MKGKYIGRGIGKMKHNLAVTGSLVEEMSEMNKGKKLDRPDSKIKSFVKMSKMMNQSRKIKGI